MEDVSRFLEFSVADASDRCSKITARRPDYYSNACNRVDKKKRKQSETIVSVMILRVFLGSGGIISVISVDFRVDAMISV